MDTSLYQIQFDGEQWWVEAPTFAAAIQTWNRVVKAEWGDDYRGDEQPESVALITTDPVHRWQPSDSPTIN